MKVLRVLLFSVIGLIVLLYLAAIIAAPIRRMDQWNKMATSDSVYMNKYKEIAKYPNLLPLVKERAQKEAQASMAKQDSVGLVINLKEKKATLMLKGVEIHTSAVNSFYIDPIFNGIQSPAYRKLFTSPVNIVSEDYSSLVKVPIIHRKAPKDTVEAMQIALNLAKNPVAPPIDPAYVNYKMEYGFRIILAQDKWVTNDEKTLQKKFEADIRKLKRENILNAIIHFKNPTYSPYIILYMDGREIRAIYRAIPQKADFVLIY